MAQKGQSYRWTDSQTGEVIATTRRAETIWERLFGLLGERNLAPGTGLWLVPCNGIHTCGMRFAIDVLVLDENGRVLRIITGLKPWRVSPPVRAGHSVVELGVGTLASCALSVGDHVVLQPAGEA